MTQATPPGDIPLYEGLGAEWNDIVGALPEDRRAELAPRLKERLDARDASYAPLKQWEDLQKSGVSPDHVGAALNIFSAIENNPRQIYDTLAKYLNITPTQAKAAVETLEDVTEENGEDPRLQTMQQQIDTLAQIALAQRKMSTEEQQVAEQEAILEKDMTALKNKYGEGEVNEEEVLMRMLHKGMSAEDAFQEYSGMVTQLRSRRPSPMLLGSGGVVPRKAVDVTKLDSAGTKSLVAQMMQHGIDESNK